MKHKTIIPAFIVIILTSYIPTFAQVLEQDSLALVAFYNSTGGPNWNNNTNWLTGSVSTWYGVEVENGRVTEIDIDYNNLHGTIPQEIGLLTNLKMLIIGYEEGLEGYIPEEIGNCSLLIGFGIGNCSLSGTIPYSIGNCTSIEFINLWDNYISGPIPSEIGNLINLNHLDLYNNQLSGPIPSEIGNCTNLVELRLGNNQLEGALPAQIANLTNVEIIDLAHNQLEGDIPEELADVTSYTDLFFHNNNFTGIPPWNGNWILNALSIENNKMTFEDIEPHFVGYMWYDYYPQDSMGVEKDTILIPGSSYNIYSGTGGEFTEYLWYKNGELLLQGTEADTLFLNNISIADTGIYTCEAHNSRAQNLILYRRPVHLAIDTTVNITSHKQNKVLSVYPNPASDHLMINTQEIVETHYITIFSLNGEPVFQQTFKNQNRSTHELDITGLAPGVYLVQQQTEKEIFTTKFIKTRQDSNR